MSRLALTGASRVCRAVGFDLVRRSFYSPLPETRRLPESIWTRPRPMQGVDLRIGEALAFLQRDLAPHLDALRAAQGGNRVSADNGSYGPVDAEVLYAVLRHAKPERVVELGSGASSHVIDAARRANAADGAAFAHDIYDPFPFTASNMGRVAAATVHRRRAEDIDTAALAAQLTDGDVLFVDTTHTVKTGGDVDRIFLDLLPRLVPGVWVHVHDIFLPYDYPKQWVVGERRAWAEQYLLQAFLSFNESFQVIFPAHAVMRTAPEALTALIASAGPEVAPGAFWMRRIAAVHDRPAATVLAATPMTPLGR